MKVIGLLPFNVVTRAFFSCENCESRNANGFSLDDFVKIVNVTLDKNCAYRMEYIVSDKRL
jgi:hypothetical protein